MAVAGFGRASLLFGWSLRGLHRLRLLVGLEAFGGPFHSFAHGGRYGESAVGEGVEWVGVDDGEACCEGEPGVVVWPHPASELVDVGRADLVAVAAEEFGGHDEWDRDLVHAQRHGELQQAWITR